MPKLKISREFVETSIGIILRVPSLFLIELWFRTDPMKLVQPRTRDIEMIVRGSSYIMLLFAIALSTLPLIQLITFYVHIICGCLLLIAYQLSHMYVINETIDRDGQKDVPLSVFDDPDAVTRLLLHLVAQCFISALVAYLTHIQGRTKFMFLVFACPVLARAVGIPLNYLVIVHNFSSIFTALIVLVFIFNSLGLMLDVIKDGLNQVANTARAVGWIPMFLSFWTTMKLSVQLLAFWLILFSTNLTITLYMGTKPIIQEGFIITALATIGECCATPLSLCALCVTISFASFIILTGARLYLEGWQAFNWNDDRLRGWTEGFTMLLIAVQTGLLDFRPLQRAFLMSILLFIVASSLIQSLYEITEPFLLGLSASHNKNVFRHVRAVVLCTFLWIMPLYMTYAICQYFDLDFWLMVIISSCLLTSVQVIGALTVYTLFMYDSMRTEPWESLDDVVYYSRAFIRVLEFFVALFVVCYGAKETLFGEWSWINSSVLIVHCYFNVWQRLQSGWKSFLLRREAVQKIESLPLATQEDLDAFDDVCAICFNPLLSARKTKCGHIFHALCLRKWLYVKDVCPLCHKKINQRENSDDVEEDVEDDGEEDDTSDDEDDENLGNVEDNRDSDDVRENEDGNVGYHDNEDSHRHKDEAADNS